MTAQERLLPPMPRREITDPIRPGLLQARNGTPLEVKRFEAVDCAALQRFAAGLSAATRSVFLPHRYDLATLARYAERNQRGDDRIYVLRHGEEIVGYFFLWEFREPVPLLGIGLADAWQGQRLGEAMMQILIEDARAAGREGIDLTTLPGNDRALRLYLRLGFERADDVENLDGDGRLVREHRLFFALTPGTKPRRRKFGPPV